ncbi:MAG: hypothetical protein ACRENS_01950 [Candidatus Eiseniibacteriota bacterium]
MRGYSNRTRLGGLVLAAVIAAAPVSALAQGSGASSGGGGTHGQRSAAQNQQDFNRKFQAFSDSLKLSGEQSPKVRAVFEAEELKAREIKAKFKGTPNTPENQAEFKKELDALRDDTHTKLQPLLTAAQMTRMQQIHDDEMKKMKEKGGKGEKEDQKGEKKGDDHK